ncbi:leucine-rich repeat-containing protein 45-like [Saccoglossus kowalevskii]|uniref:Leucine-rich repeat-containing protein 45-like n=1 Tax=Saccoglossus kowalevskii TaxID=10224 RepID=A0ABM0GJB8_SACKO|nr:PREDICTED: leucine-rich repeat-containing protein 45-like [Saccoglossus kowalevskii]
MDEFKATYLRLCKDNHVEPQDSVVELLRSCKHSPGSTRSRLDLSTTSLSTETCAVLGKALSADRLFVEVKLADCMIGDEGVKLLAYGMSSNVATKTLDLKGNNIRGAGAEALGKMMRHNHTLKSLVLEWNSLGMWENSFAAFAEGIASNNTLELLDLRNNQIGHDSAGELGVALQRNTTLKHIDLRWNNCGLLGGRALLTSLQHNRSLTRIDMAGNNIPQDIVKAIEVALASNEDRESVTNQHKTRQEILSREIRQLKNEKRQQVSDLMDRLDHQQDSMGRSNRNTSYRIGQLQEALEERKTAFKSIAAKLSMTEASNALAEQKARELADLVERVRQDNSEMVVKHQEELRLERDEKHSSENKLIKELSDTQDRNMKLENRVDELERKCQQQQEQIYELKEDITEKNAEMKVKATQADEKISVEKQKSKEALREAQQKHEKELQRVREDAEDTEKALKDRIQKLEHHRLNLEEEVSRIKAIQLSERMGHEENLLQTKQRVKEEELQRSKHLEDKIRMLQNAKDDLQQHNSQQSQVVAEFQSKYSNATLEVESLKRKLEDLNLELSGKSNETIAEVNKVKLNYQKQISRMESDLQEVEDLREKCTRLEKQMLEQSKQHRETLAARESELSVLSEKLRMKEAEMARIREDEAQRVNMLQSAIMSYVSSSRASPSASPYKS